jgi:hypothetical protein
MDRHSDAVIDLRDEAPPTVVDGQWVDADGEALPFLSIWRPDSSGRMQMDEDATADLNGWPRVAVLVEEWDDDAGQWRSLTDAEGRHWQAMRVDQVTMTALWRIRRRLGEGWGGTTRWSIVPLVGPYETLHPSELDVALPDIPARCMQIEAEPAPDED